MKLTFELNTIPQASEAQELSILALGEVWYLLFAVVLLEPFVEALCNDDAPLLLLHGCPHAAIFKQRIVTAIDGLHLGAIIGIAFRPERYKAWKIGIS